MASEDDQLQPVTADQLLLKPFVAMDIPDEDEQEPVSEGGDALSQFDKRHRQAFSGLLYLGKLEKTISLFGHTFEIRTPSQAEKIEGGLLHKTYLNTISSEIAWATITVATYLRSVDGTPLPEPIGPKDTGLRERYNWILENMRNQIVQALFPQCLAMEEEVDKILAEMGELGEA